jgi:uncharacterized protein
MDDVEALRDAVAEPFAAANVGFSYLFGPRARRDSTAGSDTDIAIRFESGIPPPDERLQRTLRLGTELERLVGGPVDLVDLEEAPLRLAGRIATERVILTGHDEQERVRFETDIVPRYLDFKYHADRLDRMILDEMAAGRR